MASILAKAEKLGVPPENLNLEYISNCTNVEELENILTVLRANEEGLYEYLVTLAEERLATFSPNNLLLKIRKGVFYPPQLEPDALNSLLGEIEGWQKQMQLREENFTKSQKDLDQTSSERATDAAHQNFEKEDGQVMAQQIECGASKSERLDVDGEKMINQFLLQNMGRKTLKNKTPNDHLASEEKKVLSLREKVKGNECFKAGEYQEAIRFYSNSIAISPSLESYNNRAIAHLKRGSFLHCISDCSKVLDLDLDNREMALDAFRRILVLEPENSIALKEMEKLELKIIVPEVKNDTKGNNASLWSQSSLM